MLLPAIMSAFLIAFVRSSEQFGVPAVLGIPKGIYVLSTRIRQEMIIYPPNYMIGAAMGVVLLLMMSIAIFIQMRIIGPRQYVTVTGKAYKPKVVALGKWKYLTFSFCLLFFVVAIVLPFGVIIISSLVPRWDPAMPLRSLSLANYRFVLTYPMVFQSIKNSIYVGVVGGFLGTIICFLTAYIVKRSRFFGRKPLEYLAYIPVAVPGIVMGISFLWIAVRLPGILGALYGTIWIMMIAFIARYIAFAIRRLRRRSFRYILSWKKAPELLEQLFQKRLLKFWRRY
jgi:iron(III) transport system permease protein